jgi:hypothetical protein
VHRQPRTRTAPGYARYYDRMYLASIHRAVVGSVRPGTKNDLLSREEATE